MSILVPAVVDRCSVCGGTQFCFGPVLWPELVEAWELTEEERQLIDIQQGFGCESCKSNLRSMTLAGALLDYAGWPGTLHEWTLDSHQQTEVLDILEINTAGSLTSFLARLPGHCLLTYPNHDIQHLSFADRSFDVIIHSDTLEHIPDPVQALRECLRVLRVGGVMLMTIPIVPSKLTRRRNGLPGSYHGGPSTGREDFRVHTEYGADFFCDMVNAGWCKVSLYTLRTSASFAVVGHKL